MKKLDKSKPYGTVAGCTEGRMYEQDNTFFTGDGNEWTPPTDGDPDADGHAPVKARPAAKAKAVKPAKVAAVKSATDAQVDDQLQQQ